MVFEEPDGATPLDPDESEGLKLAHIQTRGELDEVEQQNIQDGLTWVSRQRKHNDFLNEAFLKDLHLHLFGEVWKWAGQYRNTEKSIGVDPIMIGVELRKLLDDAQYWVENNTYAREEFAARFHHRLVQIHLFPNGNGRHARISTDIVLEKVIGEKSINWGSDSLIKVSDHRQYYLDSLREADKHNYLPLIEFMSH